jgi:hypothetical protein
VTTTTSPGALNAHEEAVLASAIRLNIKIAAGICAVLGGAIVWFATAVLLWRDGPEIGRHLALLGTFLPGYSVTWIGAWIGFVWGAVFGAISGALLYATYASTLRQRIARVLESSAKVDSLRPPTFVFAGHSLGIGLGAMVALQEFLLTNWLVVRGTASSSENAALLSNYIPGYTVSFLGSIIAAVQLFVLIYLCAQLLAFLYNRLARRRRAIDR